MRAPHLFGMWQDLNSGGGRRVTDHRKRESPAKRLMRTPAAFAGAMNWTLRNLPKYYTAHAAGRLPAVKKAIQRLATDVASLPIQIETRGPDEWQPVEDTDAEARIVTNRWTAYETADLGVEKIMRSLALYGIAAVIVQRSGADLANLHVVDPRDVTRTRTDTSAGAPVVTKVQGREVPRGRLALWYWEPPEDRVTVRPPLAECWPAVRAGLAATAFAGGYFDVASVGRLVLKPPIDDPANVQRRLKQQDDDDDERRKDGRANQVLKPGWDAMIVPVEGRDVVTDMRRFAVEEVCRMLGPPQPMLDLLDRATYSNIAEARRDYQQSIVATWGRKIGAELSRALWPDGTRRLSIRVEDSTIYERKDRLEANQVAIFSGQLTQDEAREREGLLPHDTDESKALARTPVIQWPHGGSPPPGVSNA